MVNKIGEAAGKIWQALEGKSEGLTLVQLKNRTELPDNLLHQGLGWLAREDKLQFREKGKSLLVSVK